MYAFGESCSPASPAIAIMRLTRLRNDTEDSDQTAQMRRLIFRWGHMSEGTFSHVAALIFSPIEGDVGSPYCGYCGGSNWCHSSGYL